MKVLNLEVTNRKNPGQKLNKAEVRFAEGNQKINSLKINS